jgi:glutamate 5-kinase
MRDGWRVALVSSGARSLGYVRLDRVVDADDRTPSKRLAAAVGQPELVFSYRFLSDLLNVQTCQILVSEADLHTEGHMLALGTLILECFDASVLPIINGNDPTDPVPSNNDEIAGAIAVACGADRLLFLTDSEGIYMSPPEDRGDAVVPFLDADQISKVPDLGKSDEGSGGIGTKLRAAQLAAYNGVTTTIARATAPYVIGRVLNGDAVGSTVPACMTRMQPKDRWIGGIAPTAGSVSINLEAERSVRGGSSLFASGIKKVRGEFPPESVIALTDPRGTLIGRGRVRVSSELLGLIRALTPTEAASVYVEIVARSVGARKVLPGGYVTERPAYTHALDIVRRRSPTALRALSNEVLSLAPTAVMEAAIGSLDGSSLLDRLAAATGRLSLVHNEDLVIYSR